MQMNSPISKVSKREDGETPSSFDWRLEILGSGCELCMRFGCLPEEIADAPYHALCERMHADRYEKSC